jgi:TQXA domain-containing protein
MKKLLTALLAAALTLAVGLPVLASPQPSSFKVQYDSSTGMPYVPEEAAKQAGADGRIILYSFIPGDWWEQGYKYTENVDYFEDEDAFGPSDFKSPDDYNAFMRKLKIILYAGYPNNGLGLYNAEKVSEKEAYISTQYAVWLLLRDYDDSTEYNDALKSYERYHYALSDTLRKTADRSDVQLLESKPDASQISISGNTTMTYNKAKNQWISGDLTIKEPSNYNGTYTISNLPDGVRVQTANGGNTVKAGEPFTLVSDKQVNGSFDVSANLVWMEAVKFYTGHYYAAHVVLRASPIGGGGFYETEPIMGSVVHTVKVSVPVNFTSTPKPDENKPTTPSNNKPHNSTQTINHSNKPTGSGAKTGDSTQTMAYVILMGAALAVLAGCSVYQARKRND